MNLLCILIIILGIFTIINYKDIKNLKKENKDLQYKYKVAMQTIDFLKRKINGEPPPTVSNQEPQIVEKPKLQPQIEHSQKIANKNIERQKEKENFENVFGKKIIGVIAAALIFIGIIAFGALIFTRITDGAKVALMLFASLGLLGLGTFLSIKNKNAFTISLTGTGAGALYISIFATHIYFQMIGNIAAYGFVLLWAIGMLFLSKKLNSNILAYVIHIGCLLSVLLAIGYGQLDSYTLEILIYSIILSITLLALDYKYFPSIFKIASHGLTLLNTVLTGMSINQVSTYQIDDVFTEIINYNLLAPLFVIGLLVFGIYIVNLKIDNSKKSTIVSNISYFFYLVTAFIPMAFVYIKDMFGLTNIEYDELTMIDKYIIDNIPSALSLLIMAVSVIFVCLLVRNKNSFKITILSHTSLFTAISIVKIFDQYEPQLSLIIIPVIISVLLYQFTKEDTYWYHSLVYLALDIFFVLNIMDSQPILTMVYLMLGFVGFVFLGFQRGNVFYFPSIYLIYNNIFMLQAILLLCENVLHIPPVYATVIIMAINIFIYALQTKYIIEPYTVAEKVSNIIGAIAESIIILGYSIFICIANYTEELSTADYIGLWTLSILLLVFGIFKINSIINTKYSWLGIWYAIKFTWLTIFPMAQLTDLMTEQFVFSIVCMLIALICIFFGFKFEVKSTRIYGLIIVLASVLKIVVIDMWGQDSIIRVVSLIIGGAICFAISAGYNYVEKNRLNKGE